MALGFILTAQITQAVALDTTRATAFLQRLMDPVVSMEEFVHPCDLAITQRLGFAVPAITLCMTEMSPGGYRSFLFEEFLGGEPYGGESYLIRASAAEVGVYDLFTNTMIAHYASAFSSDGAEIPMIDGRFVFTVDRDVFPTDPAGVECRFLAK